MLDWISQNLDLPLLSEDASGSITANSAAQRALGDEKCPNLVTSIAAILSEGADVHQLAAAAARARSGERVTLDGPNAERVLLSQSGPGRAAALIVPAEPAAGDVARRAAAADRSAAISHELANALGAIAGWARLAQQGQQVDEALRLIERSAQSAWASARQVLGEMSGQRAPRTGQFVDASAVMEETARLLTPKALRNHVEVRTHIEPGLHVSGEHGQLWSILWNLAINAIEALVDGGVLELSVWPEDDILCLRVSDDGPGMDDATRRRIFDRYFTTKDTGSGVGLGTVKGAVDALDGEIMVESQPGAGATFTVRIPRVEAPSAQKRERTKPKRSDSGVYVTEQIDGRFLVVDDDEALRGMVVAALEMRGATVNIATDLESALASKGPYDLVLVDLILGDERGDHVIAALRAHGITERALLMTGTELPKVPAEGGRPDLVLRKPFELEGLFEHIAELLPGVPDSGEDSADNFG